MKIILSSRKHDYVARVLMVLFIVSLVIGASHCTGEGIDDSDALADALEMLGISEEEFSFEGCLSEADIFTLHLVQGESCCLTQDSDGYGSETWFFLAGENIEDTVDLEDYVGEYELPDYQWEELADSLLPEEVTVTPDIADVVSPGEVSPGELEDICNNITKQIEELESKEAEMKSKRDELEGKLNGARIEKEKLETEKADLEEKKASCPDDIAALQNEIPVIEGRIETMQEALRQSVSLWQECKDRHPSATYRCNGYLDRVGVVYKKLQDLRRELAAKTEAHDRLQQECVDLDSRIHLGITPKLSELNSAIQKYEEDIANLSAQIAELKSKIEQIKERYAECIDELEERYEKFKERFPDGVYPGDVEKFRERIEEIRRKIGTGASELDEDKIDEAKGEARELEGEAEREKSRLSKYGLANGCLEDCYNAYQLCMQSVESKRDICGLSEYFAEAEEALAKLKECCDQAREGLINGDIQDARTMCYGCLHKPNLAAEVYDALRRACTDRLVIPYPDVPGADEDLEWIEELVDFEKNIGLLAIGELGKIPSAIVRAIKAGKLIGDQQKNACCLLILMKLMLTSSNYFEAAVYASAFVHFWHEISGLPEIPTVATSAALGLAEMVENIPQETRRAAVDAIDAVLRSARCATIKCW